MLDEAIFHAQSNKQGGAPIGRFQLVQALLAESKAELFAAESMVMEAARRYDSGEDTKLGPSSVKLFCSEMVCRAADRAVQVHGGLGYMRATPVERRTEEHTSELPSLMRNSYAVFCLKQ